MIKLKNNVFNILIFIGLIIFGGVLSYLYLNNLDSSLSIIIQEHQASNIKNADILVGGKISQEFVVGYDNFGIVAIRFHTFQKSIDDTLTFRLREKGSRDWYYTANYKTDQFQDHQLFPFGFPVIENSKGKTFQIEIESKFGSETNHVKVDRLLPVLVSKHKYQLQISNIFSSETYQYLILKIGSMVGSLSLLFPIILYLLPAFFYFLLRRPSIFLILLPLFVILLFHWLSLPKPINFEITIFVIWGIYLLKNKLTPTINLVIAFATLPYIVFQLIVNNPTLADEGASWLFIFLAISLVHNILISLSS